VYTSIGAEGSGGTRRVLTIWGVDATGDNPKRISDGKVDDYAVCSADGRWVVYDDQSNGGQLMRVSIDGGETQRISPELTATGFDISPDSKWVAFPSFGHMAEHIEKLMIVPIESGTAKSMDFQHPRSGPLRFMPDGKAVVYPVRTAGVDNLWMQPVDGSPGKQITEFSTEHITDFHWSRDGKQLGLIRGHTDSDVVLIKDQQQ
jgi:Tol biopolymer transport system component